MPGPYVVILWAKFQFFIHTLTETTFGGCRLALRFAAEANQRTRRAACFQLRSLLVRNCLSEAVLPTWGPVSAEYKPCKFIASEGW